MIVRANYPASRQPQSQTGREAVTIIDISSVANSAPDRGHRTVLAEEAVAGLAPLAHGHYVDATFGGGGHSLAILERLGNDGRLLALDRDPEAIQRGRRLMAANDETGRIDKRFTLVHAPFSHLPAVLAGEGMTAAHGFLFDLGVSSNQLDEPQRGFSFQTDGPLDMRMNPDDGNHEPTAAHLVNTLGQEQLAELFFRYGEERHGRRVARAIVQDRQRQPFTRTRQLASLLERILPGKRKAIHPATRVFQALRIAVNREMEQLEAGLDAALAALAPGGRIVVIGFHSLEDRLVKQRFRRASGWRPPVQGPAALLPPMPVTSPFRLITRKPIVPQPEEVRHNPRARSARMRIIERRPESIIANVRPPPGDERRRTITANRGTTV